MSEEESRAPESVEEEPYPSERYAWFVVGILMIAYIFSFVDRQILSLLVGPIKEDLGISENQMGLLMGFSFALFYTIFGIPLGRLADSKSRRTIIAVGLGIWSIMSTGCGLAKNFTQLTMFRMGVGVGEASLSPSAYSLITDLFKPSRIALAISIYGAGIYIGSGMAYLLGGIVIAWVGTAESVAIPLVGDVAPWQSVFFFIGVPGFLFVPFMFLIKEPKRRGLGKKKDTGSVPLAEVFAFVKTHWRTFFFHNVGFALLSFVSYGSGSWIPEFFIRLHDMGRADIGIIYGIIVIIFGTLGIVSGGFFADKLRERGYTDSKLRVGFYAAMAHIPLGLIFPLMPNHILAIMVLCPSVYLAAMPFGVAPAAIQEMMPNRMRGQASAIYLFVVNMIGLGMGPSAVALFTQNVFKDDMKIHYSLATVSTFAGTLAAILLWNGMKQFRKTLEANET
ncbi:MAG: MFS transporter [Candidatus Hydrogenedentota bacterium]